MKSGADREHAWPGLSASNISSPWTSSAKTTVDVGNGYADVLKASGAAISAPAAIRVVGNPCRRTNDCGTRTLNGGHVSGGRR